MAAVRVSIPPIRVPVADPQTGLMDQSWYQFNETLFKRTGGVNGDRSATVEVRVTALEAAAVNYVLKTTTITAGNGLTGGGDLSVNRTIDAKKDLGWTVSTGTASKGAYASYAGLTASAAYVQAESQALSDAIKALSQRVVALEAALRANGGIN